MNKNIRVLSTKEEKQLNNQALIEYYNELKEYLKVSSYSNFSNIGIE